MERQLAQHLSNLAHLDATMRLFDPQILPGDISPRRAYRRNAWFRPGAFLRLIYEVLRDAPEPPTTLELAERIIRAKLLHCPTSGTATCYSGPS